MHQSVPLSREFVNICRIPEILVELSICEPWQVCVEVGDDVENKEEPRVVKEHLGLIPAREYLRGVDTFIEECDQRERHRLLNLIYDVLHIVIKRVLTYNGEDDHQVPKRYPFPGPGLLNQRVGVLIGEGGVHQKHEEVFVVQVVGVAVVLYFIVRWLRLEPRLSIVSVHLEIGIHL